MKGVQILNYDLSHEYCNGFMRVCAEQTFFFFLISQGGGGSLFWIVIYLHCYYGQLQLTFYLVLGLVFM